MSTLSDYNNNPGNLKPPKGVTYEGQIGVDDKGFAVFENKAFGKAALLSDILGKMNRGIDTPDKFVDKFAPAGDENSEDSRENYKLFLMNQFGLKSSSDPFPKDGAAKLTDAVSAFEGGTWANPPAKDEKAPEAAPEASAEPSEDGGETVTPKHSSDIPTNADANRAALGVVGGVTGAHVAGGIETGKKIIPLVPNILNQLGGAEVNPNKPMSRMGLQRYLNSQIAPNLRLPLTELEKVSGAGKIRTMSEVQTALKAIQAVEEQKTAKPMVKLVPGRPGVFEQTGRFTTSTVPGRPPVDLTPYEVKGGPLRQAVSRQLQTAGEVGRSVIPSVGRVGLGALGGANAVMTGYDAWEMAQKLKQQNDPSWVDYARLASKTAATAGGGLSMLPFGITQIGGLALQAPEMVWSGYDKLSEGMRNATKEQTDRALTNVDPMGNPIGGLP